MKKLFLIILLATGISSFAQEATGWNMEIINPGRSLKIRMDATDTTFFFESTDTLLLTFGTSRILPGMGVDVVSREDGHLFFRSSAGHLTKDQTGILIPFMDLYDEIRVKNSYPQSGYYLMLRQNEGVVKKISFAFED